MMKQAFAPASINALQLRNRIIKSATFEGMSPGGEADDRLVAHHAELARGGVGLTTVAYGAVSDDGRTFDDQLLLAPQHVASLRRISDAVHAEHGAVAIQLAHCGGFCKRPGKTHWLPRGPSFGFNAYGALSGLPFVRAMNAIDLDLTLRNYVRAALVARDAGFDAVEIHLGHGYLLSQFLSPLFNRRRDAFGGSLERRLVFPLRVIGAIRAALGPSYPLIAKLNLDDGVAHGQSLADCVQIVRSVSDAGIDLCVLSGGIVSKNAFYLLRGERPLDAMIAEEPQLAQKLALALFGPFLVKPWKYDAMFFSAQAQSVRAQIRTPLALLGGITSAEHVASAMNAGFDFVAMSRALLSDPDLVMRMQRDANAQARCNHCNLCVAKMSAGVRCHLPMR